MKITFKKFLLAGLILSPLVLLLQNPTGFPYPSIHSAYSDIPISHYPNFLYLKRELLETGSVPLWSPGIFSGYPFASNPLSGLWYPIGWFALLFPLPLGFNLVAALHLLWGGYGLYRYLKLLGISDTATIFGVLAFEFMPKLFAHYGAGHLTLFYAVNWTPWLLWAVENRGIGSSKNRWMPPAMLGLICLADPRWAVYAGILFVTYSIAHSLSCDKSNKESVGRTWSAQSVHFLKSLVKIIFRILPEVLIAILLACPIIVPLLQYTQLSTRVKMTADDILTFSLPPGRLLGFIFPDYSGNHELIVYAGSSIIVLLVVCLMGKKKQPKERFWLWVSGLSIFYALGSYIPGMSKLAVMPGFNLLRVPSRALFLSNLAFSILAAFTLEKIFNHTLEESLGQIRLGLMGLTTFTVTLSIGTWFITKEFHQNFIFGTILVMICSIWIIVRLGNKIPRDVCFAGLVLIALIDWGVMNRSLLSFRDKDYVLQEKIEVANYLNKQEDYFRVFSPSYSLPQQVAMVSSLELADGVDPLHLEAYAEYMERATGVPRTGYQVTIPPFESGDPKFDNRFYQPNPFLLGQLNVRFVLSEFDLVVDGLKLLENYDGTRVYENEKFIPRAWIQGKDSITNFDYREAKIIDWLANEIKVSASGPGTLVLSEIMYPGWRVFIDGEPNEIETYNGLLRSVNLTDGHHIVEFKYQPKSVYIGIGIFIIGVIFTTVYLRMDEWYMRL
jgi:hypothetical protein